VGYSEKSAKIETKFFIKSITNLPESEMTEMRANEFCGKKELIPTKHFANPSPATFYLPYKKERGMDEH